MTQSLITLDVFMGSLKLYPMIPTHLISVQYNPSTVNWDEKRLSVNDVITEINNVSDAAWALNTLIKPIYKDGYCSARLSDILKLINWNTSKPENFIKLWKYIKIFASFQVVYPENNTYHTFSPLVLIIDRKYSKTSAAVPASISWTCGSWLKSGYFKQIIQNTRHNI